MKLFPEKKYKQIFKNLPLKEHDNISFTFDLTNDYLSNAFLSSLCKVFDEVNDELNKTSIFNPICFVIHMRDKELVIFQH